MKHLFLLLPTVGLLVANTTILPSFFDQESIKHFDAIKIGHTTIGIDGSTIHDMLWVIDTINGIQLGVPQHDAHHTVKKYLFDHQQYSLQQLVELETQGMLTPDHVKEFQKTLTAIKEDIALTVLPCMQQLVLKAVAHSFVEQWAEQVERKNSLLKKWAETDKPSFEQLFNGIDSAHELNLFLNDVKDFFSRIIMSCPRAWQEFVDHNQEYKDHTRKKDVSPSRT